MVNARADPSGWSRAAPAMSPRRMSTRFIPPAKSLVTATGRLQQFCSDKVAEWIASMKLGCMRCHQFGGRVFHARTRPESWDDAWRHRSLEARTADWLGPDVFPRTLAAWAAN